MKSRRGLSTVVGMVFAIIAITSTVAYVSYSLNILNQYNNAVLVKNQALTDTSRERFQVVGVTEVGNKINVTLINTGNVPINFTKMWIQNMSTTDWTRGYVPTNNFVAPGGTLTNLGQNIPTYLNLVNSYNVKLVTSRGNTQAFAVNSLGSPISIQLTSTPATVSSGSSSQLIMTVTNNSTGVLTNVVPVLTNNNTAACTPGLPTPASFSTLPTGGVVVFKWTVSTSGFGQVCKFSASLQNGYAGSNKVQTFTPLSSPVYTSQIGSGGASPGQLVYPASMTNDTSGNTYVVDENNNRVEKFNSGGTFQLQFGSTGSGNGQFNNPVAVARNSSNFLFVLDQGNNRVEIFDTSGNYKSQFGSTGSGNGQFNGPDGIFIDSANNIYVADAGNERVEKFDAHNNYKLQIGSAGSGNGQFDNPAGMVNDTSGNLYVVDSGNDRVQIFNAAGYSNKFGSPGSSSSQFNNPIGITRDGSGRIYVADNGGNRVQVFSAGNPPTFSSQIGCSGTSACSASSSPGLFSGPLSVTISGNSGGSVYVTSSTYSAQATVTVSPTISLSQAPLNIQLMTIPSTINNNSTTSELIMTVTNNQTGTVQSVTPTISNLNPTVCSLGTQTPTSYTSLPPGNTAVFKWDITAKGTAQTCVFTGSLVNGYPGQSVQATLSVSPTIALNSKPIAIQFYAFPSTIPSEYTTELVMIVTNNQSSTITGLTPQITKWTSNPNPSTASCTPSSTPSPTSVSALAPGGTAVFKWDLRIVGSNGQICTYTASLQGGYTGNTATTTATINGITATSSNWSTTWGILSINYTSLQWVQNGGTNWSSGWSILCGGGCGNTEVWKLSVTNNDPVRPFILNGNTTLVAFGSSPGSNAATQFYIIKNDYAGTIHGYPTNGQTIPANSTSTVYFGATSAGGATAQGISKTGQYAVSVLTFGYWSSVSSSNFFGQNIPYEGIIVS